MSAGFSAAAASGQAGWAGSLSASHVLRAGPRIQWDESGSVCAPVIQQVFMGCSWESAGFSPSGSAPRKARGPGLWIVDCSTNTASASHKQQDAFRSCLSQGPFMAILGLAPRHSQLEDMDRVLVVGALWSLRSQGAGADSLVAAARQHALRTLRGTSGGAGLRGALLLSAVLLLLLATVQSMSDRGAEAGEAGPGRQRVVSFGETKGTIFWATGLQRARSFRISPDTCCVLQAVKMGNSESQYTLQGSKNHSSATTGVQQKPCSLKIRSIHAKDEKAWRGWAHGGGVAGCKSRSLARSCLSHFKSSQPYASRLPGPACKAPKGGAHSKLRTGTPGKDFQGSRTAFSPENGFHFVGHGQVGNHVALTGCNGHLLHCYGEDDSVAPSPPDEAPGSPKVLIKTRGKLDGCLRVEFHSGGGAAHSPVPAEAPGGPVQLLRFSPTSAPLAPGAPSPPDSRPRSSKGSSLSSESSWYDSPWGPVGEGSEAEGTYPAPSTPDLGLPSDFPARDGPQPFHQSAYLSSLRDLYPEASLGSLPPAGIRLSDDSLGRPAGLATRVSFASDMDVLSRVERADPGPFASFTLPCRKSKALSQDPAKNTLKARMRRISDWTGSLSRKKRKLQEPRSKEGSDYFDSRSDGLNADVQGPAQAPAALWSGGSTQALTQRSESTHAIGSDPLRQNIYENFMRELEMSRTNTENPETSTETEDTSSESLSSLEQLDLLFEKEQGVVRKAGWLFFKPLVTLQKERKLELVARRKWKQYWVTLKGERTDELLESSPPRSPFLARCTLLFYETYGKNSMDQSSAPRCALFAEDSIVQSVPEHPKKENVFCLSNSLGDVYLFQATSQTDLENWVTAIHSACASLFAKKHGKEDTVRLLKSQTKNLIQKIDMDSKMKKMAELQLSVVSDPKNRKAIENQIQQWEQNLEKFHMDLFRMRCYLASLQGGELPNPKSLLAAASRPSKLALGRLGVLSVSSFHALVCSRDDSALRKRMLSLSQRGRNKKGIFSSLKGLDTLARRGKEKRPSVTQVSRSARRGVFDSSASHGFSGTQLPQNSNYSSEVDELLHYGSTDGVSRDNVWESQTHIRFQGSPGVAVLIKPEHKVEDVLALACKMRQLEPSHYGLQLRKLVGENVECSVPMPGELMREQAGAFASPKPGPPSRPLLFDVYDEIEVFPLNVYNVQLTKTGGASDFGFAVRAQVDEQQHLSRMFVSDVLPDGLAYGEGLRKGNEIMTLNGEVVSDLDLKQMEALFSEKSVGLTLIARPPDAKGTLCPSWSDSDLFSRNQKGLLPPPNQSQLLEEFLDHFKKHTTNDFSNVPDVTTGLRRSQTDGTLDQAPHRERLEQTFRVRLPEPPTWAGRAGVKPPHGGGGGSGGGAP
ncbi:T-lymphoma invasion and metastasis-inducing protein 2 [Galemys pyrenaicus]|uniref:T-lymphoma invasion and metastasis-inducing protein 2 n=1 Tax=Galemys pyrenaicus TaxID=202257 RepID=A0A8J6AIT4_GALPY|nr:T-lymphoma invasion and metastasis-inducing protein 2 [Galemys pyrenaicus]